MTTPVCLTIAGSDSGGGAGIQADLKTFAALGAFGTSAITAITAQNTRGVQAVSATDPDLLLAQIDSVLSDIRVDAIKIGMLGQADLIEALAQYLQSPSFQRYAPPVILDPVMVAASGDALTLGDTRAAFWQLIPHVCLITPNLAEAAVLSEMEPAQTDQQMLDQAHQLQQRGARAVLLKGGHRRDLARDLFLDDHANAHWFEAPFIDTIATHGTGCSLSSAITALRARGHDWPAAIKAAKTWLTGALAAGQDVEIRRDPSLGHLPVDHFYRGIERPAPSV